MYQSHQLHCLYYLTILPPLIMKKISTKNRIILFCIHFAFCLLELQYKYSSSCTTLMSKSPTLCRTWVWARLISLVELLKTKVYPLTLRRPKNCFLTFIFLHMLLMELVLDMQVRSLPSFLAIHNKYCQRHQRHHLFLFQSMLNFNFYYQILMVMVFI